MPQTGDQGLDHTPTWGRTYWGGAIYCLIADTEIRRRSDNRLGLIDALRAVLNESGGFTTEWPIDRILRVGDAAIEQDTLSTLYSRYKDSPEAIDLSALWSRLGIVQSGTSVRLDDAAPWAATRRAIDGGTGLVVD